MKFEIKKNHFKFDIITSTQEQQTKMIVVCLATLLVIIPSSVNGGALDFKDNVNWGLGYGFKLNNRRTTDRKLRVHYSDPDVWNEALVAEATRNNKNTKQKMMDYFTPSWSNFPYHTIRRYRPQCEECPSMDPIINPDFRSMETRPHKSYYGQYSVDLGGGGWGYVQNYAIVNDLSWPAIPVMCGAIRYTDSMAFLKGSQRCLSTESIERKIESGTFGIGMSTFSCSELQSQNRNNEHGECNTNTGACGSSTSWVENDSGLPLVCGIRRIFNFSPSVGINVLEKTDGTVVSTNSLDGIPIPGIGTTPALSGGMVSCSGLQTWSHANTLCKVVGGRLCTPEEMNVPSGSGCSYDSKQLWSSQSCDDHADCTSPPCYFTKIGRITGSSSAALICEPATATREVQCCADADPAALANVINDNLLTNSKWFTDEKCPGYTCKSMTWTFTTNSMGLTEFQNVPVTQTSNTGVGRLATTLQNQWTLAITSQEIAENAGVVVTQGSTCVPATTNVACSSISAPANQAACNPQNVGTCAGGGGAQCTNVVNGPAAICIGTNDDGGNACAWTSTNLCTYSAAVTGILKTKLTGATTSVVVSVASGVVFAAGVEVVIGMTPVILTNVNTATNNGATTTIIITSAIGQIFDMTADLVVGINTIPFGEITAVSSATTDYTDICSFHPVGLDAAKMAGIGLKNDNQWTDDRKAACRAAIQVDGSTCIPTPTKFKQDKPFTSYMPQTNWELAPFSTYRSPYRMCPNSRNDHMHADFKCARNGDGIEVPFSVAKYISPKMRIAELKVLVYGDAGFDSDTTNERYDNRAEIFLNGMQFKTADLAAGAGVRKNVDLDFGRMTSSAKDFSMSDCKYAGWAIWIPTLQESKDIKDRFQIRNPLGFRPFEHIQNNTITIKPKNNKMMCVSQVLIRIQWAPMRPELNDATRPDGGSINELDPNGNQPIDFWGADMIVDEAAGETIDIPTLITYDSNYEHDPTLATYTAIASNCIVPEDSTVPLGTHIRCWTVPGVGSGHTWKFQFRNLEVSLPVTTSYLKPSLTSISPRIGIIGATTGAGSQVTLTGFGIGFDFSSNPYALIKFGTLTIEGLKKSNTELTFLPPSLTRELAALGEPLLVGVDISSLNPEGVDQDFEETNRVQFKYPGPKIDWIETDYVGSNANVVNVTLKVRGTDLAPCCVVLTYCPDSTTHPSVNPNCYVIGAPSNIDLPSSSEHQVNLCKIPKRNSGASISATECQCYTDHTTQTPCDADVACTWDSSTSKCGLRSDDLKMILVKSWTSTSVELLMMGEPYSNLKRLPGKLYPLVSTKQQVVSYSLVNIFVAGTVGTVTHSTIDPIKLVAGDSITINSLATSSFNKDWTVTGNPTLTTFTIDVTESDSGISPGDGTYDGTGSSLIFNLGLRPVSIDDAITMGNEIIVTAERSPQFSTDTIEVLNSAMFQTSGETNYCCLEILDIGNVIADLKIVVGGAWTLDITSQDITENAGVIVKQGAVTGMLKIALIGATTSIFVQAASGVTFVTDADLVIGSTTVILANVNTATNNVMAIKNIESSNTLTEDGVAYVKVTVDIPPGQGTNSLLATYGGLRFAKLDMASLQYNPPTISSFKFGNPGSTKNGLVTLTGTSFGTPSAILRVTLDFTSLGDESSSNNLIVAQSIEPNWSHTELTFTVPERPLYFRAMVIVEVEGQAAKSVVPFKYKSPIVTGVDKDGIPTLGGTTITISGENFGKMTDGCIIGVEACDLTMATEHMDTTVTIGGDECTLVSGSHESITCISPPGQGGNVRIIVTVAGQTSCGNTDDPTQTTCSCTQTAQAAGMCISYKKPRIDSVVIDVVGGTMNTNGGDLIYITGENFGIKDPSLVFATVTDIRLVAKSILTDRIFSNHTHATFQAPPGTGYNLRIRMDVGGQLDDELLSVNTLVSYTTATLTGIAPIIYNGIKSIPTSACDDYEQGVNGRGNCIHTTVLRVEGRNLGYYNETGSKLFYAVGVWLRDGTGSIQRSSNVIVANHQYVEVELLPGVGHSAVQLRTLTTAVASKHESWTCQDQPQRCSNWYEFDYAKPTVAETSYGLSSNSRTWSNKFDARGASALPSTFENNNNNEIIPRIYIRGENYGTLDVWKSVEKASSMINVSFDGTSPCTDVLWHDAFPSFISCTPTSTTIGRKSIWLTVAGTENQVFELGSGGTALLASCPENFYGVDGEHCIECWSHTKQGREGDEKIYAATCNAEYNNVGLGSSVSVGKGGMNEPIAKQGYYLMPPPECAGEPESCLPLKAGSVRIPAECTNENWNSNDLCLAALKPGPTCHPSRFNGTCDGKICTKHSEANVDPTTLDQIFVTNRPLCNYLLACQPVEACLEGNKCAEGYISYYAPYSASGKCQPGSVTLPENLELALSMVIGGEESSTDTSRSMNSSITLSSLKCFVPRCGMCNPETHFRLEGECTKCPDQKWLMPVILVSLAILGGLGMFFLTKSGVNMAVLSIGVDYFQIMSLFSRSKVAWPAELRQLFRILQIFQFDIDMTGPECSFREALTIERKFWMKLCMPFVVFLFVLLYTPFHQWNIDKVERKKLDKMLSSLSHFGGTKEAKIAEAKIRLKKNIDDHTARDSISEATAMLISVMYILYVLMIRNVLMVFNCSAPIPSDGKTYLDADPMEECWTTDSEYDTSVFARLKYPAFAGLFIYCIGFPFWIFIVVANNRKRIVKDQGLRAMEKSLGINNTPVNHDIAFRHRYSRLYYHYVPEYYYWLLIILGRKFAICVISALWKNNPTFQLAVALLVMFISFTAHVRNQPFMDIRESAIIVRQRTTDEIVGEIKKIDHIKLMFRNSKSSLKAIADLEVHIRELEKDLETQSAEMNAHHHDLFNLNMMETLLLGSAVIVLLAGVTFDSEYMIQAKTTKMAISISVITILIISNLYFFAMVFHELCQQKNRRKTHKDLRQKKLKNKMLKASLNNKMINDVHTKKKSWALPSTKKAENNVQVVPLASETEEESEAETEAETEVEAEEEKKENEIKSKLIDQNINFLGSLAGLKIHSKQLAMFDSSSDEEDSKDT